MPFQWVFAVPCPLTDRHVLLRMSMHRTVLTLAAIYIFYTIPLTFATGLVDPARWADIFGQEWNPSDFYTKYLSGILPALLWTGFFALCPLMFKSLANFGSNALSVQGAGRLVVAFCQSYREVQDLFRCVRLSLFSKYRVHSSSVFLVVYDHHCVLW